MSTFEEHLPRCAEKYGQPACISEVLPVNGVATCLV